MGSVYRRGDSRAWWVAYVDVAGARRLVSSGTTDEVEARKLLAVLERRVAAEKQAGLSKPQAATVRWYAEEKWLPARRARGLRSVDADESRLAHALPVLGHVLLKAVDRAMLVSFMGGLAAKIGRGRADMSPKLVRHVYAALRVMLNDAVADGLIPFSPATLKQRRGELPKRGTKDPQYRSKQIYTRGEVEQLISDTRVPEYRRVLWALAFFGALRINEGTPRRWKHYDAALEPLGALLVDTHWDVKLKKEIPGTKTGAFRKVPVHPVLAQVLARWKLGGWARMHGRHPGPEDLIIEAPRGGVLNSNRTLEALKGDLATLGLGRRHQHALRRTFISLARSAPGLNDVLLKWVTHGPGDTILDDYTEPPWAPLCEQVSAVRVGLLGASATALLRSTKLGGIMQLSEMGVEGLEPSAEGASEPSGATQGAEDAGAQVAAAAGQYSAAPDTVANVATDYEERARAAGFKLLIGGGQ